MNVNSIKLKSLISILSLSLVVGCASTPHQESTGQYVDSSVITTRVKTALLHDNEVNGLPITVKTYKNTVQLSGFVNSYSQKVRAGEIAKNTSDVQAVQNTLVVK
ncbi:MAG TPA: BON domain-containing protein [Gammaproteobacteria bacterium]|jgi:osmotically-inducible protein OsmY|nr:BON domain-containing protein [Gammaproteobacteria bacterium]